jgi:hypothetical protein
MDDKNELRDLWASGPSEKMNGAEMIALVERDITRFDRMILAFKLVVTIPMIFILPFLVFLALFPRDTLLRISCAALAAAWIWIAIYVLWYWRAPARVNRASTLAAYTRALIARYDSQIRFHKSFKYWFLLPYSIGLLIDVSGDLIDRLKSGRLRTIDVVNIAIRWLFLGLAWLLHELVPGRVRKERDKLLAMTSGQDPDGTENQEQPPTL